MTFKEEMKKFFKEREETTNKKKWKNSRNFSKKPKKTKQNQSDK